jgi:hypothetical protein
LLKRLSVGDGGIDSVREVDSSVENGVKGAGVGFMVSTVGDEVMDGEDDDVGYGVGHGVKGAGVGTTKVVRGTSKTAESMLPPRNEHPLNENPPSGQSGNSKLTL